MSAAARDKPLDAAGLRRFGWVTGLIFIGLFAGIPWLRHRSHVAWPLVVGTPLIVVGLVAPLALRPVQRLWMRLGLALGYVNSRIILMVVFALVVTPLGLLLRLLGKDPMSRTLHRRPEPSPDSPDSFPAGLASYRKPSVAPARDRMTRPF